MAYKFIKIPNEKFDINVNFWIENFWIKYISPFRELYDRDTSPNKKTSSDWAFCCWLYCDPSFSNKIGKLKEDEKKSAILSYCPTFDFEDEVIQQCLLRYDELCLSEAAQAFKRTVRNLEKFQLLLESKLDEEGLTFDEMIQVGPNRWANKKGTAGQILDIKKKLSQLWIEYEKVKRLFEEEQGSMQLYGGGKPTIIEEGGLTMLADDE